MIKAFGGELINPNGKAIFASRESLKGLQPIIDQYRKDKSFSLPMLAQPQAVKYLVKAKPRW